KVPTKSSPVFSRSIITGAQRSPRTNPSRPATIFSTRIAAETGNAIAKMQKISKKRMDLFIEPPALLVPLNIERADPVHDLKDWKAALFHPPSENADLAYNSVHNF